LQAFLHHPAVQSVLAPFLAALLAAELLQRPRLSGLALISAFAATVYLVNGFAFATLTGSAKLVLVGMIAALLAVLLDYIESRWTRPALAAVSAIAALWVFLRILQNQTLADMFLWGAGVAAYVGWQVFWTTRLQVQPLRAGAAGLALGFGTGVAALFGASATLGSFGMALGSAAAALLLIQMVSNSYLSCGLTFTLPLSLIAGLVGTYAVLSAELPWYVLLPLAAIPLAAQFMPVSQASRLWVQSVLLSIVPLLLALLAVFLTWRVAGAPPL